MLVKENDENDISEEEEKHITHVNETFVEDLIP